MRPVVVDEQTLEVAGEQVAHDPQRQLGFLVDQRRRLRVLRLRLDRLPEALQEVEVALDVLGGGAFGRGAHDHAAVLRRDLLEDRLEAIPLLVLDAAARRRGPSPCGTKTTKRPGSEISVVSLRALRLHRILDRLDEHRLAALDQILDLARALAALELRADDLVDVEEAVLLEADLDERGLHARQDVVDDAEVDVAGDRVAFRPLEVDLGDLVVLEHGDALLAGVDRDQQLALRLRQRRTLRRRAAARLRAGARAACARGVLRSRRAGLRRPVRSAPSVAAPVGGLLLAVAPSAGAAAALVRVWWSIVRRRLPRFCGGLFDGQRFNFEVLRGGRVRRLLFRLLAPEPGQWQTISPD